jgi:hypothetical protein
MPEAPSRPIPDAAVIAPSDDWAAATTAAIETSVSTTATAADGRAGPTAAAGHAGATAATTWSTTATATAAAAATTGRAAPATATRRGSTTAAASARATAALCLGGCEHQECRCDRGGERNCLQHLFLSRRVMRMVEHVGMARLSARPGEPAVNDNGSARAVSVKPPRRCGRAIR